MRQDWMALFFLAGVWNPGPSLRKCKIRSEILEVSSLRNQVFSPSVYVVPGIDCAEPSDNC
jgi:hypothetical protein